MSQYNYKIFDDVIDNELSQQVWTYIQQQYWYAYPRGYPIQYFVPSRHGLDFPEKMKHTENGSFMSRTAFALDAPGLKQNHPLIYTLWENINKLHDNAYDLTGPGEGVDSGTQPPVNDQSSIPGLGPGWRAYTNGQGSEKIKRSHGIHRDTIDVTDDSTRTILYVANLKWLPSWMAEIIFYGEDPDGTTKDTQQYQKAIVGGHTQSRGFKIGWPTDIVAAKPGRIISYDGRMLHTTKPTSIFAPHMRVTIAFRARLKNT
jgi:hypothetical protein